MNPSTQPSKPAASSVMQTIKWAAKTACVSTLLAGAVVLGKDAISGPAAPAAQAKHVFSTDTEYCYTTSVGGYGCPLSRTGNVKCHAKPAKLQNLHLPKSDAHVAAAHKDAMTYKEYTKHAASKSLKLQGARQKVTLFQSDFDEGTVRITTPGVHITLGENISFNPRRPKHLAAVDHADYPNLDSKSLENEAHDWFPNPTQDGAHLYFDCNDKVLPAFQLGFFAALSIEANDVKVDLGGFTLEQSREHYLAQRFFALINVGSSPFKGGQGPLNFGEEVTPGGISIKNGHLGRSSHHGILALEPEGLHVRGVTFKDFEVAAVQVNGGNDIALKDLDIQGTSQEVTVQGTFSAASFTTRINKDLHKTGCVSASYTSAFDTLQSTWAQAFNEIIRDGEIHSSHAEAIDLFANPSKVPDGSAAYGLSLTPPGVAVLGFAAEAGNPTNVRVQGVKVHNLELHTMEVPVLRNPISGAHQKSWAGGALQFLSGKVLEEQPSGLLKYKGNVLSDWQMELENLKRNAGISTQCSDSLVAGNLERSTIYSPVLDSYLERDRYQYEFDASTSPRTFRIVDTENGNAISGMPMEIACGGDDMHHINKGLFGIRLDGGQYVDFRNIDIKNLSNHASGSGHGYQGVDFCGAFSSGADGGHGAMSAATGVTGGSRARDLTGVIVAASTDVSLKGLHCENFNKADPVGFLSGLSLIQASSDIRCTKPAKSTCLAQFTTTKSADLGSDIVC
jgi:hypothetical protein